jgi:hypothetical protein
MKHPSTEFDDTIASLCHGTPSDEQFATLHGLLQSDASARNDYIWQVELHSRLSSSDFRSLDAGRNDSSRRPQRMPLMWVAAVLLLVLSCTFTYFITKFARVPQANLASLPSHKLPTVELDESKDSEYKTSPPVGPSASRLGWIKRNVRFASNASVIVGTGRKKPIHLGAHVPYPEGGDTLHVWNWSKSPQSRVLKDVRLWEHQRFALSPDGGQLVWSNGDIINLVTGERSSIDLGGEILLQVFPEKVRRIQDIQFSPDGVRLAMLVSNIDLQPTTHPLRKHKIVRSEVIQIVEFPTGELLCEFPAGDTLTLRIAFSPDGKRLVTKSPARKLDQQIVERDTTTGEIRRTYEPHVEGHAYGIAVSPDSSLIAVYDGARVLLIWNTASGELQHRIEAVRHASPSTVLRFSPDGKYLALDSTHHVAVVDVVTGELAAKIPQSIAGEIHWSADGSKLTVVTKNAHGGGNSMVPLYNVHPSVQEWDWRSGKLIRSLTSPVPNTRIEQ